MVECESIPSPGGNKMQPKNQLQGVQLWPSMLFFQVWSEYGDYRDKITQTILNLKSEQTQPIESRIAMSAKPSGGLYESKFDLFKSGGEGISELSSFIENSLTFAVSVAHSQAIEPNQYRVSFIDSWYHVTTSGGFHDAHWHHGCSWCGIFYVDIGDYQATTLGAPNGGSRFYCPISAGGSYKDAGNRYVHPHFDPPLENGLLLIFPSHLLHSGLPYFGNKPRIVIAFNAQVHLRQSPQTVRVRPED